MKTIIIGAGSFGHEVAEYICDIEKYDLDQENVIGFLDDFLTETENPAWPIIGNLKTFKKSKNDIFIVAYGDPKARNEALEIIEDNGWPLATIIHPSAYISRKSTISDGCIVCPFATVGFKSELQKNVLMNSYSAIGHHSQIGKSSVLCPKSLVAGKSNIGSQSFIGSGVVVTPGKTLGKCVSVGSNSVVYRNIKDDRFVIGNPAK